MSRAEGKVTGRGRSQMAFTEAEKKELAEQIKTEKKEEVVDRHNKVREALKLFGQRSALSTFTSFSQSVQRQSTLGHTLQTPQRTQRQQTLRQPFPSRSVGIVCQRAEHSKLTSTTITESLQHRSSLEMAPSSDYKP